ncbi:hypothetical protein BDN70DRAFT_939569 [Pholiota conissans]|uniref:Uncharacterized protein n=1 Tax=Pholiota conissans TaxID=109636 RepID=A0A9P5YIN6_9AGAR|nr:hypothetical protein BDN70DRAFT_939569 [Pholiota conissans]
MPRASNGALFMHVLLHPRAPAPPPPPSTASAPSRHPSRHTRQARASSRSPTHQFFSPRRPGITTKKDGKTRQNSLWVTTAPDLLDLLGNYRGFIYETSHYRCSTPVCVVRPLPQRLSVASTSSGSTLVPGPTDIEMRTVDDWSDASLSDTIGPDDTAFRSPTPAFPVATSNPPRRPAYAETSDEDE